MCFIGNQIGRSPFKIKNFCLFDFYLIWLEYGSYIPVNNRMLVNKATVPTINNALLIILFFCLRENSPHKINIIAKNINITPKPIFIILLASWNIITYTFVSSYHNVPYRKQYKRASPFMRYWLFWFNYIFNS